MSDPICRWRNPYEPTVLELINLLPKEELSQDDARDIVNKNSPYDFYRTPYQLACQLGLYYESNDRYFPKFKHLPSDEDLENYLKKWIIHYCIPNPYTRGFIDLQPFSIHAEICKWLESQGKPLNWDSIKDEIFGEQIGNSDILKNSINTYSPIISIDSGIVGLKQGKNYSDLRSYVNVDINHDRDNKEYFFDLFQLPNKFNEELTINNSEVLFNVSNEEIEVINQVEHDPNLTQTEKSQLVAARIGQGYFRRKLILECGFCPITGVDDSRFLIASHIKPWRKSNNIERLYVKNGFLFTPTYDKLFDNGYISFTNDKRIIISKLVSVENKHRFQINEGQIYPLLPINGREVFLEYHRDSIFEKINGS